MKIITRSEAVRIHRQYPVSRLFPFCTGKYRRHGSTDTHTGHEVQDIPCMLAVSAERRRDSSGPYVRLMSITLDWVWKGIRENRIIATAGPFLTNFLWGFYRVRYTPRDNASRRQ